MNKKLRPCLSLLLSAMLLFTACGDETIVNNTQPNRVTVTTDNTIGTEPVQVSDNTSTPNQGNGDSVTDNNTVAETEGIEAYDYGNFIMLPAEYNYNWSSRIVIPESAKLKMNIVTNLTELVNEPTDLFVDVAYNVDTACGKKLETNDITLSDLFTDMTGTSDMKDIIYYYLVFLTDLEGNNLEKPYVLPITVADVLEVPTVVFTTDKRLQFSGDVEVMPVSRNAIGSEETDVTALLEACDKYRGIIPITVSHFDNIMTGIVTEVTAQDLKYYASNKISLVYRGVTGDKRSAWKYIDCTQFASQIGYEVVNFDNSFVTEVRNMTTCSEFLDAVPQYLNVMYCDGEVRTEPARYTYLNNTTKYGVREPDLVMLESGCVSDVVIDCEAMPNYYSASIAFNETLNESEVVEWMGAATKRQSLYNSKTSPIQCVMTQGVDMTILNNTDTVINVASIYSGVTVSTGTTDADTDTDSIGFTFSDLGVNTETEDLGMGSIGSAGEQAAVVDSVTFETEMGTVKLYGKDEAQLKAAEYLINTEQTFKIPISLFDDVNYANVKDIVEMPYKTMLQNPYVAYIVETSCIITKTEVVYTIRYIVDKDTATVWQTSAKTAALEVAATLKTIDSDYDKYDRINTQLTVGAEFPTNSVAILKTVQDDWTNVDTSFTSLYTPYGLYYDNIAADYGYAASFKLVCDLAGLPCEMVQGTANGFMHTWNRVCIEGSWYNIDATMNDIPVGVSMLERKFRDRCLFVPDYQMQQLYKFIYSEHESKGNTYDKMENIKTENLSEYLLSSDLTALSKGTDALCVKLVEIPNVFEINLIRDEAYSEYISQNGTVDIGDCVLIYTIDGAICYAPMSMIEKVVC